MSDYCKKCVSYHAPCDFDVDQYHTDSEWPQEVLRLRAQLAAEKEKFRPDSVWVKEMEVENQALRDRAEAAEAALAKERERAEEIKSGAEKFYNEATHLLDLADEKIAALTEQLREAEIENGKRLDEKIVAENYAAVRRFCEEVAGLTAALEKSPSGCYHGGSCNGRGCCDEENEWNSTKEQVLHDTAPILAAHDAATQKELVEVLREWSQTVDDMGWHKDRGVAKRTNAILARFPKEGK